MDTADTSHVGDDDESEETESPQPPHRGVNPACDDLTCAQDSLTNTQGLPPTTIQLGVIQPAGYLFRTLGFCSWSCLSQWAFAQAVAQGEEPPPTHPAEDLAATRALRRIGLG